MEGLEVKAGFEAAGVYPDIMVKMSLTMKSLLKLTVLKTILNQTQKILKSRPYWREPATK